MGTARSAAEVQITATSMEVFLVICASYQSSAKHNRHPEHFSVYSTFSMKIVFNCTNIWSVNLFLIKDKAPGRKLIKTASL